VRRVGSPPHSSPPIYRPRRHGVMRMPRYVDWVRSDDIVPNQTIERLVDTPVIAVDDGRFGFGFGRMVVLPTPAPRLIF
jgi:hypothetical protein